MEDDIEKYRELYALSKEVLYDEYGRFYRADDKASRHLSILTVLLGAYGFIAGFLLEGALPPVGFLEWSLLVVALLILVSLFVSWLLLFSVLREHRLTKMPLTNEAIEFFRKNTLLNIYYALARGNGEAFEQNLRTTNRKFSRLYRAHQILKVTICLFMVFSALFTVRAFTFCNRGNPNERSCVMPNNDAQTPNSTKPQAPPPPEPDPNVAPPIYISVVEGIGSSEGGEKPTSQKKSQ